MGWRAVAVLLRLLQRQNCSLHFGPERIEDWSHSRPAAIDGVPERLDAYSDKQFGEFIASHRGMGQPMVIDLSHIDFIDSSGLGALVQLAKQCNTDQQQFLVVGNARVVQTVKLVRLEEFLHLQPDLDTALGNLAA